jgi:hypothetical protein
MAWSIAEHQDAVTEASRAARLNSGAIMRGGATSVLYRLEVLARLCDVFRS